MKTQQQVAEDLVQAFTRMLTGFGFKVDCKIEYVGLENKQLIAESIGPTAVATGAILLFSGIQMGSVAK